MSTCFYHSACGQPHEYSICLPKHYIGFLRPSMSGMSRTTSMIFYLSFLPIQTPPYCQLSSIMFCKHLVYPKPLKKIQMAVSSFTSAFSLTLSICASPFLKTRSNEPLTLSISYFLHQLFRYQRWNPVSVSFPIAVKLFPLVVPFYVNYSHCSVVALNGTVFVESVSLRPSNVTSNDDNSFLSHDSQFH